MTGNKDRNTNDACLSYGPVDMFLYEMSEDDISDKSGYIVKERIWIPPAFSEYRTEEIPEQIQT